MDEDRICETDGFVVVVVVMWTCGESGSGMEIRKVICRGWGYGTLVGFGLGSIGSLGLGCDNGVDAGATVAVVDGGLVTMVNVGDGDTWLRKIKSEYRLDVR
jgi:hypothetical protein